MLGRMNSRIFAFGLAALLGCSSSSSRTSGSGGEGGEPDTGGKGGGSSTGGSTGTGGKPSTGGSGGGGKLDASTGDTGGAGPGTGGGGGSVEPDAGMTPPKDAGTPDQGTMMPPGGNPFVYVGAGFSGTTIRIFQLDLASGALMSKGTATANSAPTYMAFHPTRKFAYALSENDPGSIVAFSVDGASGGLTRLNQAASGGDGPAHISVHGSGKWLFCANYNSGHIAVLPIDGAGKLGAAVDVQRPVNSTAHNMRPDPAGKYVFLSTPGGDKVFQYKFDEATGKLSANSPASIAGGGQGPRHLDFAPNAKNAYAIGETGGGLISYDYDAGTGLLSNPQVIPIGGNQGAHVQVHPSGKFVWASVRTSNTVAGFSIDAATGRPKLIEKVTMGLASPWDFAVEPTGKYLLVANDGGGVRVFKINEQTGALTSAGAGVAGGTTHYVGVSYPP